MAMAIGIQQQRYAAAFDCLKQELPQTSAKRPGMWQEFLSCSHLEQQEALEAVTLNGTPPVIFATDLGAATWGLFDPDVPGRIALGIDVLEHFALDAGKQDAQNFLIAKTLHELCHWGCFRKQVVDNDEAGEKFEAAVFGQELRPWWRAAAAAGPGATSTGQGVGIPAAAGNVFKDPAARAIACQQLLGAKGHVPGRLADPDHAVFSGEDVAESLPRGLRNSNPGNIRADGTAWRGLSDPADMTDFQIRESSFCVFREPEWGLRAIASLLRTYKHKHNLVTPRAIISRWAPASDNNDVDSYSGMLASALGVDRDAPVDADDDATVITMMRAIARHETGVKAPYSDAQFRASLLLL